MKKNESKPPISDGEKEGTPDTAAPEARRRFFSSRLYDFSGMDEAMRKAPPRRMSAEELKRARRNDWIALIIGIPALIGFLYIITLLFKRL